MAALINPGLLNSDWTKPSTILFATEVPHNEKAFSFALAQAREFSSDLILFHAYDTLVVTASDPSGIRCYDSAAAASLDKQHLEPLAARVRELGLNCEVVVRPGLPADEILAFTRERKIDRVVMGTHSPGPIGKLLVGSVAEAVLRTATVPVFIVGPQVVDGAYRNFATRTILCAVSLHNAGPVIATFAAELAAQHNARLILEHVITPQDRMRIDRMKIDSISLDRSGFDRTDLLAGRPLDELEAGMLALVPRQLQGQIDVQTIVVPGDPTEELLYQSRAQLADLIVMGAHGASAFAAITRHGVVYKTLAHAQCPVITLSPVVLEECGSSAEQLHPADAYLAGVF
jgi:nucleotide-binding universal stress UspA family protein